MESLWVAKTGLDAQQTRMTIVSNNLANVNTNGYKKSRAIFEDLLYQNLSQVGGATSQDTEQPTGLNVGTGVRVVATEKSFTQGTVVNTANPLDVMISGRGFFQVLLPDGTQAYTRDGSFKIDSEGRLVTATGYEVQPSLTIPNGVNSITIAGDGPERAGLTSLARRLGMQDQLFFDGQLPAGRMPAFLQQLDVLVLPSRSRPNWAEQFGRVLIEAMACGVPVVSTRSGGPDGIISDGVDGYLVAREDDHFIRRWLRVGRKRSTGTRMGTQARQAAQAGPPAGEDEARCQVLAVAAVVQLLARKLQDLLLSGFDDLEKLQPRQVPRPACRGLEDDVLIALVGR